MEPGGGFAQPNGVKHKNWGEIMGEVREVITWIFVIFFGDFFGGFLIPWDEHHHEKSHHLGEDGFFSNIFKQI